LSQIISIVSIASLSPLGNSKESIWKNYLNNQHCFVTKEFNEQQAYAAILDFESKEEVETLKQFDHKYKSLDSSVLYAIAASRRAFAQSGWKKEDVFGVNLGSSRGATELFEKYHQEFLETGKAQTLASPTTTLGNISSWVAHDLQSQGPEISHSITCSTALHALLNGVAWLRSGMASKFLVGGSEAPLTDFTIAQMKALKIYASVDRKSQSMAMSSIGFRKRNQYPYFRRRSSCLLFGNRQISECIGFHRRGRICNRNFGAQYINFNRSYLFSKIHENGAKRY
jgi:3-oxoacyl-(acyl-carrier-protein) synthase